MAKKSTGKPVPSGVAAHVLFLSDRTCCVCRIPGKPVQIHHLDNNPRNHQIANLGVLCFDCHRETQLKGGFDRKLDSEQVVLYREDWHALVAVRRASQEGLEAQAEAEATHRLDLVTSLAEIYRQNEQYDLLAYHYDVIGNHELRDKYIEKALSKDNSDDTVCTLRILQGKPDLIPKEVVGRELKRYTKNKDWSQRARFHFGVGHRLDAVRDYLRTATEDLKRGNLFAAAFYLKEMVKSSLIQDLFLEAFKKSKQQGDLWWQIRALQELGLQKELHTLLEENAVTIEKSGDKILLQLLAKARNDRKKATELAKEIAERTRVVRINYSNSKGQRAVTCADKKAKKSPTLPRT